MKFTYRVSPNYRQPQSTSKIMMELALGLLAVFGFTLFYYFTEYGSSYGIRAILLMLTACAVSVLTELVFALITKRDIKAHMAGTYPLITPIILTLICPISITYFALGISTFLAVLIAKLLFGGFGQNIFNPAGVGRAIVFASFAGAVAADAVTGATPITTISNYGWIVTDPTAVTGLLGQFSLSNLFVGMYPGAMGETSALVILLVGAILAWRKVIDWKVPVTYLVSVFVLATFVGLMHGAGMWYPMYHLLAGGVIFGAVFMMTDPVTNPTSSAGRVIFAIGCAILTVLIRVKANYPEGVVFSILIMNMLTPAIERLTDGQQIKRMKKNVIAIAVVAVVGIASVGLASSTMQAKIPTGGADVDGPNGPDTPALEYGDKYALNSEEVARYKGEVLSTSEEGTVVTYLVKVNGYGMVDDDGSHGFSYAPNEIEVKIDKETKTVVGIKYVTFGDTAGFGDLTMSDEYYALFEGLSIEDLSVEIDTVSSATCTSKSVISAVRIAMDAAAQ